MHISIGQLGSGRARRALMWPKMHLLQEADAQSLSTQSLQRLMSPALSGARAMWQGGLCGRDQSYCY